MYTPRSFRVDEIEQLHGLIRGHSFGMLFTQSGNGPVVTHLPFMIDPERGRYGTLIAHMARANPHWRTFDENTAALVVFLGPHSYISPSWYVDQATVPTWNYAAVHVYGRPVLVADEDVLRGHVLRLTAIHEAALGNPWDRSQAAAVFDTDLKAIVGFEIRIERIEGKWKFNQNRSREDQAGVVAALQGAAHPDLRTIAQIMKQNLRSAED